MPCDLDERWRSRSPVRPERNLRRLRSRVDGKKYGSGGKLPFRDRRRRAHACARREGVIADITFTSINNLNCGFDGHQRPILLIMIQSSEGEITRDGGDQALKTWQNQGFQESLPQVLFTNSNESMPGMSRRAGAGVAYEVVRYAPDRHVPMSVRLIFFFYCSGWKVTSAEKPSGSIYYAQEVVGSKAMWSTASTGRTSEGSLMLCDERGLSCASARLC
jgi:hypothetical protein